MCLSIRQVVVIISQQTLIRKSESTRQSPRCRTHESLQKSQIGTWMTLTWTTCLRSIKLPSRAMSDLVRRRRRARTSKSRSTIRTKRWRKSPTTSWTSNGLAWDWSRRGRLREAPKARYQTSRRSKTQRLRRSSKCSIESERKTAFRTNSKVSSTSTARKCSLTRTDS